MRTPAFLTLILLAACASPPVDGGDVTVRATPDSGGLRVWFRLTGAGAVARRARLDATGGRLIQVTHSPDRRTASVLWLDREGELRCRFPGGQARIRADAVPDPENTRYVFLKRESVQVSALVPRGCPMTPRVVLRVFVAPADLPARLAVPGGQEIRLAEPVSIYVLQLPRSKAGELRAGELKLRLHTSDASHTFLVGVDADGTPSATLGYVEKG